MKKIILILLLGLFGCDKFTTYTMSIDNRTDDTIRFDFPEGTSYANLGYTTMTFPPSTKNILFYGEGRQSRKACNAVWVVEGSIEVTTSSGRKLQKKMWNADNWECSGSNEAGWVQTFVITEDDLE